MESQKHTDAARSSTTRRRPAALGLVLALLALLAIAATANAFVARRTETTLGDFDTGIFSYTGLLDLPDEGIDSVQLMPLGLAGDWETADQTLPLRLANLGAVAVGNRIYVVGGTDNDQDARTEVYSYEVGEGGALSEYETQTALPQERAAAGVAVYDPDGSSPVLYVVGGFGPSPDFDAMDTIYRAPINPTTGAVGAWVLDDQVLPAPMESPVVAVHGDTLYIIGGWDSNSFPDVVLDTVYRASIGASGALGELVETTALEEPLYGGVAIAYDGVYTDTLYLIGGRNDITSTAKVFFADVEANGDLTDPWTVSEGILPVHLYGHGGVYVRGEIILTGGVVNAVDPTGAISSTVKAALVDPANITFRLYDWCEGVGPPACTIGAWQTGDLLPDDRALHGAVAVGNYLYVLGGQDFDGSVRDTIFYGTVDGAGAVYAASGKYRSDEIDLGQQAKLLQLEWDTTIGYPEEMGLTMQYRYSLDGYNWVEGPAPVLSEDGSDNSIDIDGHPEDVVYFQYQANLSTTVTTASPLLNSVKLYYEVPDPDLAVIKDTGTVISAELGTMLAYTITYSNSGGWRAENAVLTEVLPENTTFAGSDAWHQVGATNVYTYAVGDVGRGEVGTAGFRVRVNDEVPPNTEYITNVVSIDYEMRDFRDNIITDPFMGDNEWELGTPLNLHRAVDLAISDLVWYPGITAAGEWPRFCLTVANIGTADALPLADELGFWVELYIKRSPSEPPQHFGDHDWGYCLYDLDPTCIMVNRPSFQRYIPQLLAGDKIEDFCFEPQPLDPLDPSAIDYPAEGVYNVYVQVDVAWGLDNTELGRYVEGNEANNLAEDALELLPVVYHVYLPLVLRSAP